MSDARRIQLQPAYVLHHRPYRDTSRILELFTRDHGRVSVFARGARGGAKASASLLPILQPFNRLLVSWSGRGEAGQLTGAEFDGAMTPLPADRLVHGFYLNELLLKLFARHDSHPDVFALYSQTMDRLKLEDAIRPLRLFEKRLLEAIGYGLALERDAQDGSQLDPDASYHYRMEQGPVRVEGAAESALVYSGATLLSIGREELSDPAVCTDARRLLRAALDRCLDGRELRTRHVMLALRKGK
ncbi:DNA repair protein RecO [Steroidobacter agaridevorans]|uniref:DNA repair protein RecO n=1 Tax=Steroidobacter agaridevorans TaxID=2695856 RepID=A0A829YC59_9GAMM|nr:DNA repair protein RecO [Steroidobacter agaridevorans]GFE80805.1 DNA repair protein RecO [Steroidobacter agaridevorans]